MNPRPSPIQGIRAPFPIGEIYIYIIYGSKGFRDFPVRHFSHFIAFPGEESILSKVSSARRASSRAFEPVRTFDTFAALDKANRQRNIVSRYDYSEEQPVNDCCFSTFSYHSIRDHSRNIVDFCSFSFHERNSRRTMPPLEFNNRIYFRPYLHMSLT